VSLPAVDSGRGASTPDTLRLAGIAYIAGAPQFIGNVVPLVLGAIADRFHATPLQLGTVNSCFTAMSLLATVTAPWWVARVPAAVVTLIAAIGVCAVFVFAADASGIPAVYALFALAGAFAGFLGGPSNARIGQAPNPARWWSLSMSFQMVVAALYSIALTWWLQPRYGTLVALPAMALMFAPCIVAAIVSRRDLAAASAGVSTSHAEVEVSASEAAGASRLPLAAAFVASTLYALGGVAYWIFVERMAREAGVSAQFVGVAVGLSTIAAAASAAIAAAMARRLRLILVIGATAGVIAYAVMLEASAATVVLSAVLFNVAWGMLVPGLQSVIRGADHTNRFFVAGPATIFVGGVTAGPIAGAVAQAYGYDAVMELSIALTLAALLLGLAAYAATRARQEQFSGLVRSGH
jgi:hypothetical protein